MQRTDRRLTPSTWFVSSKQSISATSYCHTKAKCDMWMLVSQTHEWWGKSHFFHAKNAKALDMLLRRADTYNLSFASFSFYRHKVKPGCCRHAPSKNEHHRSVARGRWRMKHKRSVTHETQEVGDAW